ncbi:hypothetical protein V8C34DRAFT_273493 [Trichoderma compactum]
MSRAAVYSCISPSFRSAAELPPILQDVGTSRTRLITQRQAKTRRRGNNIKSPHLHASRYVVSYLHEYTRSYPYKLPMLTISRSSILSHLPRLRKDRLAFSHAAALGAPCELSSTPRTSSPARDMNQAPMPGRP